PSAIHTRERTPSVPPPSAPQHQPPAQNLSPSPSGCLPRLAPPNPQSKAGMAPSNPERALASHAASDGKTPCTDRTPPHSTLSSNPSPACCTPATIVRSPDLAEASDCAPRNRT